MPENLNSNNINELLEIYKQKLHIESTESQLETPVGTKEVFGNIEFLKEEIFVRFSRSVIEAEYLRDDRTLELLDNLINSLYYIDYTISDGEQSLTSRINELNTLIKAYINAYKSFISITKTIYTSSSDNLYLFRISNPDNDGYIDKYLSDFKEYVLNICKFEFALPQYQEMCLVRNNKAYNLGMIILKQGTIISRKKDILSTDPKYSIYQSLFYKCNFLIQKITDKTLNYMEETSLSGELEIESKSIMIDQLEVGEFNQFTDWLRKSKYSCLEPKTIVQLQSETQKDNCELSSFVRLARYYKETFTSIKKRDKFDELIFLFDSFYIEKSKENNISNEKYLYDNFSLEMIRNFIYNCRFSYFSKLPLSEISFEEIELELDKIKDIQFGKINNFHPYEKIIQYSLKFLDEYLNGVSNSININSTDIFNKINDWINKYEESIEWFEHRKSYPFLLPIEESCVVLKINNSDSISVFTPSTFARIIDYSILHNLLHDFKRSLKEYKSLYNLKNKNIELEESVKEIKVLKSDLENKIIEEKESVESRFKTERKNNFEMLGIFSGVITFLFGTVSLMSSAKETNLDDILKNMTLIGAVILLLISSFLLISPIYGDTDKNQPRVFGTPRSWVFLIIFFSLFLGLVLWLHKELFV